MHIIVVLSSERDYKESLSYCLENAGFIVKDAVRNGELDQIYNEKIKKGLNKLVAHMFEKECCYCQYCNQQFEKFSPWPAHYDFPKYKFEMWNKDTGYVQFVVRWIVKDCIVCTLKRKRTC